MRCIYLTNADGNAARPWLQSTADNELLARQRIFELGKEQPENKGRWKTCTMDEWLDIAEAMYLTPIHAVSRDEWEEMLNCLPPMQWHTAPDGVELFCMCEFTSGRITNQFARLGDKYACKPVRFNHRADYITREEMESLTHG